MKLEDRIEIFNKKRISVDLQFCDNDHGFLHCLHNCELGYPNKKTMLSTFNTFRKAVIKLCYINNAYPATLNDTYICRGELNYILDKYVPNIQEQLELFK